MANSYSENAQIPRGGAREPAASRSGGFTPQSAKPDIGGAAGFTKRAAITGGRAGRIDCALPTRFGGLCGQRYQPGVGDDGVEGIGRDVTPRRAVERSSVMPVIFSEHATHRATMLTAEQTLQAALVGATAAQAKTAIVAFYRTARSSAITNGLSPHQFSIALRELIGQET